MLMENQKIGVRAEGEGRAGESFPPVKVDREERFQTQVSCTWGSGQEEKTVELAQPGQRMNG